ncbi:PEGA domain-containing protein [Candidatus Saccharibacteria bacterium]|nr:PEGA domain-containing protein [Candidatus Saccharibacteria bacterium]
MDRKKSKKIQNIRIILTNAFMTISVLVIVFVLILIAQGYSISHDGNIQQSGLIQIDSTPRGANVKIDGETQLSRTKIGKMLSPGNHDFVISKSGYDTWHSTATVFSGLLTNIEWVRLFPLEKTPEEVQNFGEFRMASLDPSRTTIIAAEQNSSSLSVIDLQNEKAKTTKIDLPELLGIDPESAKTANIFIDSWNTNSTHALLRWHKDDATTAWFILNIDNPDKSRNISEISGLNITKALIANDSASKFWLLDNEQKLYSIDISATIPSPNLITESVEKITNNKDIVAYTKLAARETDPNISERTLYIYKDGELDSTTIKKLGLADANADFVMGTYWDAEWLAYYADKNVEVLSGKYPSADKKTNSLKSIHTSVLDFKPQTISANPLQRIISFAGSDQYYSYDIVNDQNFTFKANTNISSINWLDNFIIWQRNNNKVIIRDFDGQNRREIINDIDNDLPVVISKNNKWLYYFTIAEQDIVETNTEAEQAAEISNEAEIEATPKTVYTLKRLSL